MISGQIRFTLVNHLAKNAGHQVVLKHLMELTKWKQENKKRV